MRKIIPLFTFFLFILACKSDPATIGNSEKSVDEIKAADKISSIVRNPISANNLKDTVNVAKIEFENDYHDFGTIDEGDEVTHTFKFKNTGKVNLIIADAKSSCGCTVPKWPKEPIAPGGSGKIEVLFSSRGKKDYISKPIRILANTNPQITLIHMKGNIKSKTK